MLVDATAVPADRGGVGRYVDGLIVGVGRRRRRPRGRLPARRRRTLQPAGAGRDDRARPGGDRPPAGAAGLGADGPAAGRRSRSTPTCCTPRTTRCRCGRGCRSWSPSTTRPSSPQPDLHTAGQGRVLPVGDQDRAAPARPAASCPSKATRDELIRVLRRRPDPDRRRLPRGRPRRRSARPARTERQLVQARLGLRGTPYVAFLGTLEPRKNVPALVRGWVTAVQDRRAAARARARRRSGWDDEVDAGHRRGAAATCGCCGPATCASTTCAGSSAARPSSPTRRTARASACRCWRRWPAGRRC